MASLAHKIGWIIFPVKLSLCPRITDTSSRSVPLMSRASLPEITSSSSVLISFPSSSLLPLPAAATTTSLSVIQAVSPVVCTSASAYSSAKLFSSPIGEYFFRMICPSLSVKISKGVPSLILRVFRIIFRLPPRSRPSLRPTISLA